MSLGIVSLFLAGTAPPAMSVPRGLPRVITAYALCADDSFGK
uniref:Uncharacterized protein n=1 Tax=Vitis vinifera TaxID=29760 RepID=F6HSW2_VITVI